MEPHTRCEAIDTLHGMSAVDPGELNRSEPCKQPIDVFGATFIFGATGGSPSFVRHYYAVAGCDPPCRLVL
jgi:hypothetical protein